MSQNKKSPYAEGREAYTRQQSKNPEGREAYTRQQSKNPYPEFSGKWCEWNRGFNSMWMSKGES